MSVTEVQRFSDLSITREEFFRRGLQKGAAVLEIGPLNNPILSREDGFRYFTLDVGTKDELVVGRRLDDSEAAKVAEPDFICRDGNILEAVGPHSGHFDCIISSHSIEHIPNPVSHIQMISTLLKPNGVFRLAIPDCRGIYDYFRPPTTLGQWLQAYIEKPTHHSIAAMFDGQAYVVSNNGTIGWPHSEPLTRLSPVHSLRQAFEYASAQSDGYRDAHAWIFTPTSFTSLIYEGHAVGLIDLLPAIVAENGAHEFFVDLTRRSRPPVSDGERINLRARAAKELAAAYANLP